MLGGEVAEGQQLIEIVGDLRDRLAEPGAVGVGEAFGRAIPLVPLLNEVKLRTPD